MNLQSAAVRNEQKRLRADLEAMNLKAQARTPEALYSAALEADAKYQAAIRSAHVADPGFWQYTTLPEFPAAHAAWQAYLATRKATPTMCSICRTVHGREIEHVCE